MKRNVYRLTPNQRIQVTTCRQAMQEALNVLGGTARVSQVVMFVQKKYAFRDWKASTIQAYFSIFSQAQMFVRVSRGEYRNAGRLAIPSRRVVKRQPKQATKRAA